MWSISSTWPLLTTKLNYPHLVTFKGREDFELPIWYRISTTMMASKWYMISSGNTGKQMKHDEATYMMKYDETQRTMMNYDEL